MQNRPAKKTTSTLSLQKRKKKTKQVTSNYSLLTFIDHYRISEIITKKKKTEIKIKFTIKLTQKIIAKQKNKVLL